MKLFVTAIGTDSGKTLVSAILTKALSADYWKPVQAGLPTDSSFIEENIESVRIFPEAYKLTKPMSPHGAAEADGVYIDINKFQVPVTDNNLIIEGAGGLLVPVNNEETIADVITVLNVPVVLVVNLYLGCINHALLTINELKRRNISVKGIVFNGDGFEEARSIIVKQTSWPVILSIPTLGEVTPKEINELAKSVCL